MSLVVYAIVDRETRPPRGLATVRHRALAAVVRERPGEGVSPPRDPATLMRHEAIVESIAAHARALPVRYGTVLPDEAAVARALADRYDTLTADLERLGGLVELGVLALWAEPPDRHRDREHETTGTRYLAARRRAYASAESIAAAARALAAAIDDAVCAHTRERRLALVDDERLALRAAYLVTPSEVTPFRDAIDRLRARRRDVRIIVSGPWPPYTFVSRREPERGMDGETLGAGV